MKQPINVDVKKSEAKVVSKTTLVDLQDKSKEGKTVAFCRCWRSKTFPYCDGSHTKWNEVAKDNVCTPLFLHSRILAATQSLDCCDPLAQVGPLLVTSK